MSSILCCALDLSSAGAIVFFHILSASSIHLIQICLCVPATQKFIPESALVTGSLVFLAVAFIICSASCVLGLMAVL